MEIKECGVEKDPKNSPKGHGYILYLDCGEGSQLKTFVEIHQIEVGWGWGSGSAATGGEAACKKDPEPRPCGYALCGQGQSPVGVPAWRGGQCV